MNRKRVVVSRCFLAQRLAESCSPADAAMLFFSLEHDLAHLRRRLLSARDTHDQSALAGTARSMGSLFAAAGLEELATFARALAALIDVTRVAEPTWIEDMT